MESQSRNPEFRNNPENFHPCILNEQSDLALHCFPFQQFQHESIF